jgi:hypothetical protein
VLSPENHDDSNFPHRLMIRRTRLFLLALPLGACVPAVQAPAPAPADQPAPSALSDARARWRASGISRYRVRVSRSCMCMGREPVDVEVHDGEITSVRVAQTGAAVPREQWEWTPSIDRMFDRIAEAEQAHAPVEVRYDPVLGYPAEAVIGTLANDAGIQYSYTALVPIR